MKKMTTFCNEKFSSQPSTLAQAKWRRSKLHWRQGKEPRCFSMNKTKTLNLFKYMTKYLAETTEFDIIKHKEIILTPPSKKILSISITSWPHWPQKNFTWTFWEFPSQENYIIMCLPGWFISVYTYRVVEWTLLSSGFI